MHNTSSLSSSTSKFILIAAAGVLLAGGVPRAAGVTIAGTVAGSAFTPPSAGVPSTTVAATYRSANVCVDANDNDRCDAGEPAATTDAAGAFALSADATGPLVAEIGTDALLNGHVVSRRVVFRAAAAQVAADPAHVSLTPLSTETLRLMEAASVDFATARQKIADRLGLQPDQVTTTPDALAGASQKAWLAESVILTNRFGLAAKMADRHDVSPAALVLDPNATGPAITIREAQQAAMNLEAIPRYDYVFVIVLENRPSTQIKNSVFAPKINAYLNAGNQFISYNATGNPSEPNRLAIAAADDFGITDDNGWNCVPAGAANQPDDPLPAGLAACTQATNHNIKNRPDLMTTLAANGMTWRVYSESMNPGRDPRLNGASSSTIIAPDHVYPVGTPITPTTALGNSNLLLTFASQLYATKHNESVNFQSVRSASDFFTNNRTMGGGQWDDALRAIAPAGWDVDQLGTDLWSGGVGNLNYLEPDQCDDMHGVTVTGKFAGTNTTGTASDCSGNALIYRSDVYTDALVRKIQASPVWTNTGKRTAIVISFDEGTATTGLNSCCGWNPAGKTGYGTLGPLGPLARNADGTVSVDTTIANYGSGNKGHGASVFGVLTNQPDAPTGVVDSDAYSHFSFVRTLQDAFGISDPGDDWSYMNRSKYTEKFIAANLANMREYTTSPNRHFDAVRPMNHAFVIPPGYVQKTGIVTPPGAQTGPDVTQTDGWALDNLSPLNWRRTPSTTATATPLPNAAGWNHTPVTVMLQATDDAGGADVQSLRYTLAGAQADVQTVAGNVTSVAINAEGSTLLSYLAHSFLGFDEAAHTLTLNLDLTPPAIAFGGNAGVYSVADTIAITCEATDGLSGIKDRTCPAASGPAYLFTLGLNQLNASATDHAGNAASQTATFTVGVSVESLTALTRRFVAQPGIANSLAAKLAAGAIRAYQNELNAQSGKAIDAGRAALLAQLAAAL